MARNFLTSLRLVNISSDPPTGNEGELYYNTVTDKVRLYSNGVWIDVVAASSGSLFNVDAIAYPDYIAFDTTPELSSATPGTMSWNNGDGSLDLILKGGNVTIPLGQEICSLVYNAEATTLNPGEAVYMFGAQGQRVSVKRASNATDVTSSKTFGLVAESIPAGTEGFVMVHGIVKNLNTNGYNEGDQLYVGSTPGTLTSTKPSGPQHGVFIGVVVKKSINAGRIFVKAQNGYELDELHDVRIQSASANQILSYSSASNIWINESILDIVTRVDGTGSNIDADLLDGQHGSYYQNADNLNAGTILAARMPALTGDITTTVGTVATTLANTTVTAASYGSASAVSTFTVDAKGRLTAASNAAISIAQSAVTNLTSDLALKAPLASPTFTGIVTAATLDLTTAATATTATSYWVETGSDGILRPKTLANTRTEIVTTAAVNAAAATTVGTITSGTWNAGIIGLTYGGTNANLTAINGGVVYSTGSAMAITAAGTAGQVLTSNGASAPTWQAASSSGATINEFFLSGM